MKSEVRNDRLSRALCELEARPASPGFTNRVLERLENGGGRRRPSPLRWAAAAAFVGALAIAVIVVPRLGGGGSENQAPASAAAAESLELERSRLLAELEALEEARRPVIYLGANSDYDLVLDLDPLLTRAEGSPVVPALQDLRLQRPGARNAARRQP